jgi:MoaA/NifB/PqqE/SkfB family radical SAM enzyme
MAIPGNCLNDCIFCGYKGTQFGKKLSLEKIKKVILDFSQLGGKSIKILGEGEPLLRKDILEILGYIKKCNLHPVLFTCGDVIGNNKLAQHIHNLSGLEIAKRLDKLNTTIMLKYESKNQDKISRRKNFSKMRNTALKRILDLKFNHSSPTRLGFGIVVLSLNYKEIHKNYEWALKNNIYPLLCPLMPLGKAKDLEYREKIGISNEKIVNLSANLYKIAEKYGIKVNCPSDFPGGLPCDIARAGFYIGDTGDIYVCESEEKIGNIDQISLKEAWKKIKKIKDKKYGEERWCGFCYEKRKREILPKNFDKLVKKKLINTKTISLKNHKSHSII